MFSRIRIIRDYTLQPSYNGVFSYLMQVLHCLRATSSGLSLAKSDSCFRGLFLLWHVPDLPRETTFRLKHSGWEGAQHREIKDHTLNDMRIHDLIEGIFLNCAVLGSLGSGPILF